MSDLLPTSDPTVEEALKEKWGTVADAFQTQIRSGEAFVRGEPLKAVAYAVGTGYLLRILPIGAIIRSLIRVLLFTAKPAVVIYGAAKAYEIIARSRKS